MRTSLWTYPTLLALFTALLALLAPALVLVLALLRLFGPTAAPCECVVTPHVTALRFGVGLLAFLLRFGGRLGFLRLRLLLRRWLFDLLRLRRLTGFHGVDDLCEILALRQRTKTCQKTLYCKIGGTFVPSNSNGHHYFLFLRFHL